MCPESEKDFFKFWWSQKLDCLKAQAIDSSNLWQAAGRPRLGAVIPNATMINEHIGRPYGEPRPTQKIDTQMNCTSYY